MLDAHGPTGKSEIRVIHRPLHPELDCNKVLRPCTRKGTGPRLLRGGGAQLLDCTALSSPLGRGKEYQQINVGICPPSHCSGHCSGHCQATADSDLQAIATAAPDLVYSDGTNLEAVKPDGMGGEGVGVGSGAICRQQTFEISCCENGVSCRRPLTTSMSGGAEPRPGPSLVLAREEVVVDPVFARHSSIGARLQDCHSLSPPSSSTALASTAVSDCELSASDENPHRLLSRNGHVSDMTIPTAVVEDDAPEVNDPDFIEIDDDDNSDDGS